MLPDSWGVFRAILAVAGLIFGPILAGIMLGGLQWAFYKLLQKLGLITPDDIPMFIILVMRGLFMVLAVIAVVVLYLKFGLGEPGFAPAK